MSEGNQQWTVGELVVAEYKTGVYLARIHEWGMSKVAVAVLAVLRHPEQGDLHHPQDGEVPFFHQRRALAEGEKALVMPHVLRPFVGEVPNYRESLRHAWEAELGRMMAFGEHRWAERAIVELRLLEREYGFAASRQG